MKHILTYLSIALLISLPTYAQPAAEKTSLHAMVDERTEILSIIFRLAGSEEYSTEYLYPYTNDIKKYFESYKDHKAVAFAKRMIEKNNVGFDAVMSMAVHLGKAPDFKPLITFTSEYPDKRWGSKNAVEFSTLIAAFYHDTNFKQFFEDHKQYYSVAQQRFEQSMGNHVDIPWYEKFYGVKPEGNFNLIIGLGNGGNNYGSKVVYPGGKEELYSIIANALPDSTGLPTFKPENIRSTIIHEYNHSFINHLVYKNEKIFKAGAARTYKAVADKMEALHYGQWQIMVCESLVRVGEIQYDKMHGATEDEILVRIRNEQARGFVWMDKLVETFARYESSRDKFPTFESFIPELATFYKNISDLAPTLVKNYDEACGKITNIEPLKEGEEVDPAITELVIYFNKPMQSAISINFTEEGLEHFPFVRAKGSIQWNDDGKSLKLKVALKPSWNYSFIMTSLSFRTKDGYPLKQQTVRFRTKAQ